jgi:hypothetical protein
MAPRVQAMHGIARLHRLRSVQKGYAMELRYELVSIDQLANHRLNVTTYQVLEIIQRRRQRR